MEFSDINALSDESLVHQEMAWQDELTGALLRHRLGKLVNTASLRGVRRSVARAQTVLTAREREAGLSLGALKEKYRASYVRPSPASNGGEGTDFLKSLLDGTEQAS